MTARSDTFADCLKEIVSPELAELGFRYDRSRTYRRLNPDQSSAEVVNFQLGQRRLEGRFTVNLGATSGDIIGNGILSKIQSHNCLHQSRLGKVLPPRSELLKDVPYLGMMFGANDKWWRFTEDKEFTSRQVRDVLENILNHGIPWLETNSS